MDYHPYQPAYQGPDIPTRQGVLHTSGTKDQAFELHDSRVIAELPPQQYRPIELHDSRVIAELPPQHYRPVELSADPHTSRWSEQSTCYPTQQRSAVAYSPPSVGLGQSKSTNRPSPSAQIISVSPHSFVSSTGFSEGATGQSFGASFARVPDGSPQSQCVDMRPYTEHDVGQSGYPDPPLMMDNLFSGENQAQSSHSSSFHTGQYQCSTEYAYLNGQIDEWHGSIAGVGTPEVQCETRVLGQASGSMSSMPAHSGAPHNVGYRPGYQGDGASNQLVDTSCVNRSFPESTINLMGTIKSTSPDFEMHSSSQDLSGGATASRPPSVTESLIASMKAKAEMTLGLMKDQGQDEALAELGVCSDSVWILTTGLNTVQRLLDGRAIQKASALFCYRFFAHIATMVMHGTHDHRNTALCLDDVECFSGQEKRESTLLKFSFGVFWKNCPSSSRSPGYGPTAHAPEYVKPVSKPRCDVLFKEEQLRDIGSILTAGEFGYTDEHQAPTLHSWLRTLTSHSTAASHDDGPIALVILLRTLQILRHFGPPLYGAPTPPEDHVLHTNLPPATSEALDILQRGKQFAPVCFQNAISEVRTRIETGNIQSIHDLRHDLVHSARALVGCTPSFWDFVAATHEICEILAPTRECSDDTDLREAISGAIQVFDHQRTEPRSPMQTPPFSPSNKCSLKRAKANKFHCPGCGKEFSKTCALGNFNRHLDFHCRMRQGGKNEDLRRCLGCDKTLGRPDGVKKHKQSCAISKNKINARVKVHGS